MERHPTRKSAIKARRRVGLVDELPAMKNDNQQQEG
jgi:hypothetical protein